MLKKPKKIELSTYRNKCDRALQDLGRTIYDKCLVCGGQYSCLHHFFPKSRSSALRYNLDNCVPICHGCHNLHHTGDPRIHAEVIKIRGMDWFDRLEHRHNNEIVKPSKTYYREILANLAKVVRSDTMNF